MSERYTVDKQHAYLTCGAVGPAVATAIFTALMVAPPEVRAALWHSKELVTKEIVTTLCCCGVPTVAGVTGLVSYLKHRAHWTVN
ncbi:MAG TPA: hypothetical protein VD999_01995 [Vitreimonas sp.]|nr:hypothetical protein [Vitreimonas sp.]